MILGSGENCVRSVLWHFRWVFRSCWATLARALSVPGRSLVLGCQKLHCRGLRTSVRSAQMCIFAIFPAIFVFFPRRFEHGHFSCKGGRDMAGKIPTTFATSCNRPSALWASQPSLLSSSFLSTFVLQFSLFSVFFLQFFFFSPLSLLPSLLLSPFFPQFSSIFPSSPLTSRFFQHFLVKPTCLSVTSLPTLCPVRHLKQANATCCESAFLLISRYFWAHPKNEGPN